MMSLTMEQVLNKRHRMLKDMVEGMVLEVRTALAGTGAELGIAGGLREDLDAVLQEDPAFYNDDENFMRAVKQALERSKEASDRDRLYSLGPAALFELGPAALAQAAAFVAGLLEHPERVRSPEEEGDVRGEALQLLQKVEPVELAKYAASVVALLDHADVNVRTLAVQTLGELQPAQLATHADALLPKLEDRLSVRKAAVRTIGSLWSPPANENDRPADLKPAARAKYVAALICRLEDKEREVRQEVANKLFWLEPAALAEHSAALSSRLETESHPETRNVIHKIVSKLG